ncbi:chemotaxis protein CheW [Hydrogenovibrio kuenenii]|uniref:chemotaxis protein CheW n=1 Tax=Hydrogenovibrio kuenenii TaxID=63658 RepID=UPI00046460AD|nr:chemotaxis protein CheW [Hydrogenovibrio kuenenii]
MSESKKEFLTFKLGKEDYAVEINRVQEIRGWQEPSPLPNVPAFVKGVIDLRGEVVPILDLRERFHLNVSYNATTVVIVVNVSTKNGERIVGFVVDAVSDVHQFDLNTIQPAPDVAAIDNQFMMGLTTIVEKNHASNSMSQAEKEGESAGTKRMVILIDIDKLASDGMLEQISDNVDNMPLQNG